MSEVMSSFPIIRKRDGRLVKMDKAKIFQAIDHSFQAIGINDPDLVERLADLVVDEMKKAVRGTVPQVEEIQDIVETVLLNQGYSEAARSYIIYRHMRTTIREGKSVLMDTVEKILMEHGDEASFNLNSPSAKMTKIASAASRNFYLSRLIPSQYAEAHNRGEIHIHDLDYYGKTLANFQIPLGTLLEKGFFAGYGFIRPPKRIGSLTSLAAIILQCCQTDMFGAQSYPDFDREVADYATRKAFPLDHKEVEQAMEGLVYNLNSMYSRVAAQVPLSCINLGLDTTPWGRLITHSLLKALEQGLGKGETPLFPQVIFQVKKGVNLEEHDPNHDLLEYATRVAARRMNPTFAFMDAPFNRDKQVAYFADGCRVYGNLAGMETSTSRGNLALVTVNLARTALKVRIGRKEVKLASFFQELERILNLAESVLIHRYEILSHLKAGELPFIMGEKLYLGSEHLTPESEISPALKNGTLAIGFWGLNEALKIIFPPEELTQEMFHKQAIKIVEFLKSKTEEFSQTHNLNFVLESGAGESLLGRFATLDQHNLGIIPGINDREYYSNSCQLNGEQAIHWEQKLEMEAPFHPLTLGGHYTFVQFEGLPQAEKVKAVILRMAEKGIGYGGISFPLDECIECGSIVSSDGKCPDCKKDRIRKIRRVNTYLTLHEYLTPVQQQMVEQRKAQIF